MEMILMVDTMTDTMTSNTMTNQDNNNSIKYFETHDERIQYLTMLESCKRAPLLVKAACLDVLQTGMTRPLRMLSLVMYAAEDGYSFCPRMYGPISRLHSYMRVEFDTSGDVKEYLRLHEEDRDVLIPFMAFRHREAYQDTMNGLIAREKGDWEEGGFGIPSIRGSDIPTRFHIGTHFTKHLFLPR